MKPLIQLVPIGWDYDRDGDYQEPEDTDADDTDERIARRLGK